ncbi:hypothetical protein BGX34_006260 [Mortierella sp. NVP85]|nr:hypothetical protein BGX34_006260 [Mortierella sp. NVP85]
MDFIKAAAMAKLGEMQGGGNDSDEEVQKKPETKPEAKPETKADDHEDLAKHEVSTAAEGKEVKEAQEVHEKVYKQGETVSDEDAGKAAGVEAFEKFEERGTGEKSDLMQMAMAEAMKLISGGKGEDKSTIIKNAVGMATKLFATKAAAGGEGGGGLAGLLSNPAVAGALQNPTVSGLLKNFM